jgi:hypothetical protein
MQEFTQQGGDHNMRVTQILSLTNMLKYNF